MWLRTTGEVWTTPVKYARGLRVGEKLSGDLARISPRLQGVNENDTFSENEGMIRTIPVNYILAHVI